MFKLLSLRQFRSYDDQLVKLNDGVTIFVGPNGSGKTNLLEALYVLSTGSSFRAREAEMIKLDHDWFRLEGIWGKQRRTLVVRRVDEKLEKQFNLDGVKRVRLTSEFKVPAVLFEPDHLFLLKASPALRRDYLDTALSKLQPDFTWLKHQFERVLAQRNAVLKKHLKRSQLEDQLFAWDVRFAELAWQLVERRQQLVNKFDMHLSSIYSKIAREAHVLNASYKNSVLAADYQAGLLQLLSANIDRDCDRGFTSVGPQRDDFTLDIDGQPAPSFASRGETRSIVLALKVAELRMLHQTLEQKPLLLLDDVFSELDPARCQALAEVAREYQTIITSANHDDVAGQYFFGASTVVKLPIQAGSQSP